MEILLTITYTLLFVFLIGKSRFFHIPGISSKMIKTGFLLKVISGIAVGLVYTYYYTDRLTADTFKFFDDSEILFNALHSRPADYLKMLTGVGAGAKELQHYYDEMTNWYDIYSPFNDNRTMIRVNALLRLISFGHYYVHVVFIAFLSFTGIIAITKVFRREYPHLTPDVFLVFLLLPSVLFWGSGLLKDALVFFALGLTLLTFTRLIQTGNHIFINSLTFLMTIFLLMITKFQVFLLVLPLLFAWALVEKFRFPAFKTFLGTSIAAFIIAVAAGFIYPPLNFAVIVAGKQAAFFDLVRIANAGSAISIPELEADYLSLIINSPHGFITGLTRPFLTDPGPLLSKLSAIENLILLIFGAWSLLNIKKPMSGYGILLNFCLFYTITYLTLIGMVTPILGAMVRYKAQALPFMVMIFIIISSGNQTGIVAKYYYRLTNYTWKLFSR